MASTFMEQQNISLKKYKLRFIIILRPEPRRVARSFASPRPYLFLRPKSSLRKVKDPKNDAQIKRKGKKGQE